MTLKQLKESIEELNFDGIEDIVIKEDELKIYFNLGMQNEHFRIFGLTLEDKRADYSFNIDITQAYCDSDGHDINMILLTIFEEKKDETIKTDEIIAWIKNEATDMDLLLINSAATAKLKKGWSKK